MKLTKWLKSFWGNNENDSDVINDRNSDKTFLKCSYVSLPPQNKDINKNDFIVVAPSNVPKWALFKCPCKCGHVITLSLSLKKNPRWRVYVEKDGSPSLYPSVRQLSGCLSHFWVKNGKILWCVDTGKPYTKNTIERQLTCLV